MANKYFTEFDGLLLGFVEFRDHAIRFYKFNMADSYNS